MKYNRITFKIFFFTTVLLSIFITKVHSANQAFIVMKINNEIITNINIENEYKYLLAINPELKKLKNEDKFSIAKNSFLREKIKKIELLNFFELNNYENDPYLENTLKKLYNNLNLTSENEFQNYLLQYDLTIDDVKKKLEIELKWNELIYAKFNQQVSIDVEEMKKKIKKNDIQKNYLLSEIFFTLEKKNEINERYNLIKKSISEIGFKSTVTKFSLSDSSRLGGRIGWVSESELSEVILSEIKKLNVNEITKPINLAGGFLILKLEGVEDKKTSVNFEEELNNQITNEKNRQLNQFSLIYYNKIKFNTKIIDEK